MKDETNTEGKVTEYLNYQERNKLLWSLRSDFAWAGKKIPESVEIDNEECRLRDMIKELEGIDLLSPDEIIEIRALIPKLEEKAKVNEEMLETEELTVSEAETLYEEATGILRAVMELKDRLEGKVGEKSAAEFKRMLNTQKLVDEKRWQEFIKSLK
ncbi:DUF5788 family protein [Methanosarcina hadiensis]|uniref:DUF5788 family protein n=1 Tax=Methanosarcina hadiensis TaxID=3078083 RepID=UPI00397776CA